jgi:hypothetical protein
MANFTSFFKGKSPIFFLKLFMLIATMVTLPAPPLFAILALFVLLFAVKRNRAYTAD